MPVKQREMLWDCSNDYDTEVKYKKGTTEATPNQGVCSGLSAEWCKNILKGVRPELSKPFLVQGMIYQRFYDFGFDKSGSDGATVKLFATAGLNELTNVTHATARKTAAALWATTGVFWIGLTNHAIAAARRDANRALLFFDPNFGCYAVHSELRLKQLLRQARKAVGAGIPIEEHKVELE